MGEPPNEADWNKLNPDKMGEYWNQNLGQNAEPRKWGSEGSAIVEKEMS